MNSCTAISGDRAPSDGDPTILVISFTSVIINNRQLLDLFACFLSFSGVQSSNNSLIALSRACRRTYALLTSDGPTWQYQCIDITLRHPTISRLAWTCIQTVAGPRVALLVRGFTARQQEVVRRVLGGEVYDKQIAPQLVMERVIAMECDDTCFQQYVPGRWWVVEDEFVAVADAGEEVDVYTQLSPASFTGNSFPYESTAWLFGCYEGLLLPPCVRWVRSVRMVTALPNALSPVLHEECRWRTLLRMPLLIHLRVEWDVGDDDDAFVFQPEPWVRTDKAERRRGGLTLLPELRSLQVRDLYLVTPDGFLFLLDSPNLVQIKYERLSVLGWAASPSQWSDNDLSFAIPLQWHTVPELLAMDAERTARKNRRLKRALCAFALARLQRFREKPHVCAVLCAFRRALTELQPQQQNDDQLESAAKIEGSSAQQALCQDEDWEEVMFGAHEVLIHPTGQASLQ